MPRPKTDDYWDRKIHELAEKPGKPGAARIRRELEEIALAEGRSDEPSARTIGRILRKHRAMSGRERAFYREFHWPQAMEARLIPWEATRVALDLLRYYHDTYKIRPPVWRVLWHWRLSLVNPDWEIVNRDVYASLISAALTSGRTIRIEDSTDSTNGIDGGWALLLELSPHGLDLFLTGEPWEYDPREFPHHNWEIADGPVFDGQGNEKEG